MELKNTAGEAVCDDSVFVNVPFETFVSKPLLPEPCPIMGKLKLTDITGFGRSNEVFSVEVGCTEAHTISTKLNVENESCSNSTPNARLIQRNRTL